MLPAVERSKGVKIDSRNHPDLARSKSKSKSEEKESKPLISRTKEAANYSIAQ